MSDINEKSNQGTLVKPEELEEIIPQKPAELSTSGITAAKVGRPKKADKAVKISIDHTPAEVLSFDKEGYHLTFEDDPDRFLELPLEVAQNLSRRAKEAYHSAFFYARKAAEERLNPPSGIGVTPGYASAQQQLKVEGGRKGMHRAWQRPDQVRRRLQQGYKVCTDPTVRTFNSMVGSTHTLGDMRGSEPEQILLEVPQEKFDAHQEALADKAVGKSRNLDEAAQSALDRMGGGPLPERFGAKAVTPKKKEVIRQKVR